MIVLIGGGINSALVDILLKDKHMSRQKCNYIADSKSGMLLGMIDDMSVMI
jgi:hypothetical protein